MENSRFVRLDGRSFAGNEYRITLGPWDTYREAKAFSDFLTDSRIGEQISLKFGVESIKVIGQLDS